MNINSKGNSYLEFGEVGKLYWDNTRLSFEGNIEESAKIFIDYLCKIFNEHIEFLLKNERDICYKKYSSKEILSEEALERAREASTSKEESLKILQRAGILDENGNLSEHYKS